MRHFKWTFTCSTMKSGGDAQKMESSRQMDYPPSILLFKENKIVAFITLWTYLEIGNIFFQSLSEWCLNSCFFFHSVKHHCILFESPLDFFLVFKTCAPTFSYFFLSFLFYFFFFNWFSWADMTRKLIFLLVFWGEDTIYAISIPNWNTRDNKYWIYVINNVC